MRGIGQHGLPNGSTTQRMAETSEALEIQGLEKRGFLPACLAAPAHPAQNGNPLPRHEPIARKVIKSHPAKMENFCVEGEYSYALEGFSLLQTTAPDIVFLDIQ